MQAQEEKALKDQEQAEKQQVSSLLRDPPCTPSIAVIVGPPKKIRILFFRWTGPLMMHGVFTLLS